MQLQRVDLAGLTTRIAGPPDAAVTCVLLHGFGAPGDDLVDLAYAMPDARCVFPEAPLALAGIYGVSAGSAPRAWWMLDLASLDRPRDRRGELPEGLPAARAKLSALLDALAAPRLVLGGFSQGAMLALDVALHREQPPAALALMSGTLIAEAEWQPRLARLAGVPVLQSHGEHDPLLPFAVAEELRDRLRAAGARVTWHAFAGGHEIPPDVVAALAALVRTPRGAP